MLTSFSATRRLAGRGGVSYVKRIAVTGALVGLAASKAFAVGDVPGPTIYDSYQHVSQCTQGQLCPLTFARVPSGWVLKATNLNCAFEIATSDSVAVLNLLQGPLSDGNQRNSFDAVSASSGVSLKGFALNVQFLTYFTKAPLVYVGDNNVQYIVCKLSGEMIQR